MIWPTPNPLDGVYEEGTMYTSFSMCAIHRDIVLQVITFLI